MNFVEDYVKASILIESADTYRSILHGLDSRRVMAYKVYYSKILSYISELCLVTFIILPFLERPSSLIISSDVRSHYTRPEIPCGYLEFVELMCLFVFLFKLVLLAFLFWKDEYLKNKWSHGEAIVILISFLDLLISVSFKCNEFYRVRRFLRPYFLICNSQMLKKTIKCLWSTLPEVASFLLLLLLWTINATLAGMCLFSGPLRSTDNHSSTIPRSDNFRWFYEGFYNLIVLLSTANHPDVMLPNYNKNRLTAIYLIIFVSIGTFVFMNLFTAIMFSQFRGYLSSSVQKRLFRRRVAVRSAFEVLKSPLHGIPVVQSSKIILLLEKANLPPWKKERIIENVNLHYDCIPLKLNEFMDLFRLLDLPYPRKKQPTYRYLVNPLASQMQRFLSSGFFAKVCLSMSVLNVIAIAIELSMLDERLTISYTFFAINLSFAAFYFLEQVAMLWVHGVKHYCSSGVCIFDCIIALLIMIFRSVELGLLFSNGRKNESLGWSPFDMGQLANLLVIIRALRFAQVFTRMPTILAIMLQLPKHLAPVLGIFLSAYYFYALLGLSLFHEAIRYESNSTSDLTSYDCGTYQQLGYWSLNFNDFASSLIVLWSLMVTNNWHVIVKAFTDQLGRWVHVYMISWWLISAVILIKLTTAMIIESFLYAQEARQRDIRDQEARINRISFDNREQNSQYIGCSSIVCCNPTRPTDTDDLLPALEISSAAESINATHLDSVSRCDHGYTFEDVNTNIDVPSFSFAEIFSAHLQEPSNNEIVQHLQRHPELSCLDIASSISQSNE